MNWVMSYVLSIKGIILFIRAEVGSSCKGTDTVKRKNGKSVSL